MKAAASALSIPIGDLHEKPYSSLDEKAEEGLADAVRKASLLIGTFSQIMTREDGESVFPALMEGVAIVYQINDLLSFFYNDDGKFLKAVKTKGSAGPFDSLSIPSESPNTILTRCFETGKTASTFESGSIFPLDEKLISRSSRDGFFAFPLYSGARNSGYSCVLYQKRGLPLVRGYSGIELLQEAAHVLR